MDSREQKLTQVLNAFPFEFDFYHLGKVELKAESSSLPLSNWEESSAVAFRIQGDINTWIVILFKSGLDISTYTELGNILVSKIVTRLSSQLGNEIMISPPQILRQAQVENLSRHSNLTRRSYAHLYNSAVISVETWVLPTSPEGFGYA